MGALYSRKGRFNMTADGAANLTDGVLFSTGGASCMRDIGKGATAGGAMIGNFCTKVISAWVTWIR